MKELSVEQKAKRYDEAIKRAKELLEIGAKDTRDKRVVLSFFPELKESEDDRIRKELTDYIKRKFENSCSPTPSKKILTNWIAWLEKQSNKRDIHLLELKAKAYDDARERMSYAYNQNRVPIGFISEIFPNLNSYENQDDKPQGKSALEAINEEEVDNANKVEPKFNLYDWVVTDKGDTVQIGAVNNGYYTLCNGMDFNMSYVDKCWHKWTIKDAKDGDVLISKSKQPFIYNGKFTETTIGAYCGLNVYGVFVVEKYLKESSWTNNDNIRPATEEQRNILMKEIHRANFKWDADKKELKNCKL